MWWYWPEAHGYVGSRLAVFLWGVAIACDLIYPFVLRSVRRSELVLPDGRLAAAGSSRKISPTALGDGKKTT